MILTLAAVLIIAPPQLSRDVEPSRFLSMIERIEHWDGLSVGHQGELFAYQMKPAIFRQYGLKPIRENAEEAAKRHFVWCAARLKFRRKPVTVAAMAAIWKAGWSNYLEHRLSEKDRDYVQRAVEIYYDRSQPTLNP